MKFEKMSEVNKQDDINFDDIDFTDDALVNQHNEENQVFDDKDLDFDNDEEVLEVEKNDTKNPVVTLKKDISDSSNSNSGDFEEQSHMTVEKEIEDFDGSFDTFEDSKSEVNSAEDSEESDSSESSSVPSSHEPTILYILSDKVNVNYLNYFRGYGLPVSQVFTKTDSALRNIQYSAYTKIRLVIMDTGSGRITNSRMRDQLVELVGLADIADDIDIRITIFYTDKTAKKEIEYSDKINQKCITWFKFRSTADVLANMLQFSKSNNEKYMLETNAPSDTIHDERVLSATHGKKLGDNKAKPSVQLEASIALKDIIYHHENEIDDETVEGYNVAY